MSYMNPPRHPGKILKEKFLARHNITEYRAAKDMHVPARRINEIVHGIRSITTDTALRLGTYFGMSPLFWIHKQALYDMARARQRSKKILASIRTRRTCKVRI
jgi:antitoxin HigA-1